MATNTYEALDTKTLSSATASITFSSIPQTYTDLVIVCNGSPASAASGIITINGDTGSNYSYTFLTGYGNGTSLASGRTSNEVPANTFFGGNIIGIGANSVWQLNFMNYSNTTTNKTVLSRLANGTGNDATVLLYRSNSAITSITLQPQNSVNWSSGSTFTMYGIAREGEVVTTAKATGGTITYGVDHTYHVFTSGGTFTPSQNLTCDYVIVGGGGGGGNGGGGGGAGGYRSSYDFAPTSLESQLSLTNGVGYTVTVGSGGAGGVATRLRGGAGNPSSIAGSGLTTITAAGGGSGAGFNDNTAANLAGGSGGGGANAPDSGQFSESGAGTAGQGFAGGRAWRTPGPSYNAFGGGGGARTSGTDGAGTGSSPIGGAGGIGFQPTGATTVLANGGLGGSESGTNAVGASGASNTGDGGGGGKGVDVNQNGGAGGSGIVIIRYAS